MQILDGVANTITFIISWDNNNNFTQTNVPLALIFIIFSGLRSHEVYITLTSYSTRLLISVSPLQQIPIYMINSQSSIFSIAIIQIMNIKQLNNPTPNPEIVDERIFQSQASKKISLKRLKLAVNDITAGLQSWRLWLVLGWQDIRLRYRRSQLGPFWIAISTAIMIYSMGFLYGHLFKVNLTHYYPFLAAGIITWTFISTVIMESSDAFMEAQVYIKQIKLPYTIFILRILIRNFIIFLHNFIPVIPILIYFHIHVTFFNVLDLLFAFIIFFFCGYTYGMVLAIIGTRFRDIKQIINSLIQVIFLITPIMWQPNMLPEKYKFAARFNPFNQIIELIRAPLTGNSLTSWSIILSLLLTIVGIILLLTLLWRTRHRIAFWI